MWQAIIANFLGTFLLGFLTALQTGSSPKVAAVAGGVAAASNLAGLFQKPPVQITKP